MRQVMNAIALCIMGIFSIVAIATTFIQTEQKSDNVRFKLVKGETLSTEEKLHLVNHFLAVTGSEMSEDDKNEYWDEVHTIYPMWQTEDGQYFRVFAVVVMAIAFGVSVQPDFQMKPKTGFVVRSFFMLVAMAFAISWWMNT